MKHMLHLYHTFARLDSNVLYDSCGIICKWKVNKILDKANKKSHTTQKQDMKKSKPNNVPLYLLPFLFEIVICYWGLSVIFFACCFQRLWKNCNSESRFLPIKYHCSGNADFMWLKLNGELSVADVYASELLWHWE